VQNAKLKKGFGLLEVLIGLGILSVAFFALLTVSRSILQVSRAATYSLSADFLLEEGVEAIRSIRDRNWTEDIATLPDNFYLYFDETLSRWESTTTPEVIEGTFTRELAISDVYRDGDDDIAASGTLDPGTKKFVVTVTWQGTNATTTRSMSVYLTNYFND